MAITPENNPEDSIVRARAGDAQAISALIEQYRPYLRLLARLHVGKQLQSKLDGSDLVQEACLQAINSIEQFRGSSERELTAWLRQILTNAAINTRRHFAAQRRDIENEQRQHFDQSSQMLDKKFRDPGPSPSQRAVERENAVLLANALERLTNAQREVIILREFEGLKVVEIAKRMDRTEKSIQSLWARGVIALRALMSE
jgi:RNA polymerase sigma-70 factor (ECF subfamily)